MATRPVDVETLLRVMAAKRMTRATLAEKSGLSRKTIDRTLDPPADRGKRPREETVMKLAKALDIAPIDLVASARGKRRATVEAPEKPDVPSIGYSQMNVRVDHATRNALSIVSRRYGVTIQQIIKLAPILFLSVAERSLAQRSATISALKKNQQEAYVIAKGAPHLSPLVFESPYSDDIITKEENSIAKNKIFSDDLYDDAEEVCSERFYTNEWRYNPFAVFLEDFVSESTGLAEVKQCGKYDEATDYKISAGIFGEFFGGDPDVIAALAEGTVGIHEIPNELKERSIIDFIKNKALERGEEARRKWDPSLHEKIVSELKNISVPDEKSIDGGEDD